MGEGKIIFNFLLSMADNSALEHLNHLVHLLPLSEMDDTSKFLPDTYGHLEWGESKARFK